MGLDFVAIDWETANSYRQSPCSVGLTVVREGAVSESWSSLMRPPERYGYFTPANTAVHGLHAEDVADAPRFEDLWPTIVQHLQGLPLVAHNATFDLSVIKDATSCVGAHRPPLRFGCSLVLARRHYTLASYTLDRVAAAAGARLDHHHEAAADALAAAEITLAIAADLRATTLDDVFEAHELVLGTLDGDELRPCRHGRRQPEGAGGADLQDAATLW